MPQNTPLWKATEVTTITRGIDPPALKKARPPRGKAPSYAGRASAAKAKIAIVEKPAVRTICADELLPDGAELLTLTISGQAATKKNSQRKTRFGILPSLQYMAYEKLCKTPCEDAWMGTNRAPIDFGVALTMRVFLSTWQVGDATGYMQSIGDIIQKHKILEDDKWLHWSDGGQHWFGGVDKENPRMELRIVRLRHPKEEFRLRQEQELAAKMARKSARESANILKTTPNTVTHETTIPEGRNL